ncbi:hypothetical protein GP486_002060 [Trichoglossum hirsutum]|uniref:Uncharacterized protein n=1 Tax=Trichoglossum hirsutum TaxID=265104 RepID=A0A9P8LFY0_9PEZI|nr:hypothetical protein GP486_002060 [Trichoglossum hirsutum]
MKKIFDRLSIDPNTRVVLLTGAGEKAFTTGLDVQAATSSGPLSNMDGKDAMRTATALRRHIQGFQDCISSIERCEKPVIAILHGYSIGLAVDICTAADVRLCTSSTQFAVKEVDIGLAADIGTLSRLPKVVSSFSWVKDVCLSARTFGANEALRVGLVSGVYESKDDAVKEGLKISAVIASKSPVAVQGTKELLNWSLDHTTSDGLRYTSVWNSAALQSKDLSSAILSGLRRRTPTFEKL